MSSESSTSSSSSTENLKQRKKVHFEKEKNVDLNSIIKRFDKMKTILQTGANRGTEQRNENSNIDMPWYNWFEIPIDKGYKSKGKKDNDIEQMLKEKIVMD